MTKQEIIGDLINALIKIYPEAIEEFIYPPPTKSNNMHFITLSRSAPLVLAFVFDETSNMCLFQCLTPPSAKFELWSAKEDKVKYGALVIPYVRQALDAIPLADNMYIIKKDYHGDARTNREYSVNDLVAILSKGFSLPAIFGEDNLE